MKPKEQLLNFLKGDKQHCEIIIDKYIYEILKIPYGFNLDILYCGYNYGDSFSITSSLEYSGIYDREKQNLYALDYKIKVDILELSWDNNQYPSGNKMFEEMNQKFQDIITNYVICNQEEFYEAVPKDYESYIREEQVYKSYIENKKQITYHNSDKINSYNILLEYLDKGDEYLTQYTLDYIMKNKKYIGKDLVDIDTKNKYLNNFYQDKNHKIHKIKNIVDSLETLDCSNVHVFINKEGYGCDFKYSRDSLLNNFANQSLYSYYMTPSSRSLFVELFGKYADFCYEDIVKIEFRNKIIYEDKDFQCNHEKGEESLEL